ILAIVSVGIFLLTILNFMSTDVYNQQSYVFGTLVDISIAGENKERAASLTSQILQVFQQLHQQLHAWKPDSHGNPSALGELNHAFAQGTEPITISPQLAEMLKQAQALSYQSQGLFNPAIGHLISTWGFHQDTFEAVAIDDKRISTLVQAKPSMTDIVIQGQTAYSRNQQVKLDFGGYAKGYALDKAGRYLRQQGVKNALINIGGNILALGQNSDKPWRVGIQHPRQPGAIATLNLQDGWAIGTSGDYQRYFILGDQRYCHIIDPRSGYPVQHTQAVTVLIPPQKNAGVLSDVASKPIFIAAAPEKAQAAADMGITHFMVIDMARP
ncbi:MAG: FAD:protein FMN transferase, partial [Methylotenera sp.]